MSNGNGGPYASEGDEDSEIVMSSSPDGGGPPLDAAHVPKKLWRHSSMDACANLEAKNEAKVLVLYTGTFCEGKCDQMCIAEITLGFFFSSCCGVIYNRGNDRHDAERERR